MPTFDKPSPLTAASDAAGGVAQGIEIGQAGQRADIALAQKDRELDIQDKTATANIQSQQLHDKIDQAVESFRAQCEPLLREQLQLQVKGLNTANATADIARKAASIELQVQQWGMKNGIPQQLLKTSLDKAKADIVNTVKEGHLIDAQTNASNAQAGLTRAETAWGPSAYGGSGATAALQNTRQLETTPKFKALPPGVQSIILKLAKQGVSLEGIAQAIQQSPSLQAQPKVQAAALAALGVAPPAAQPQESGANPWAGVLQGIGNFMHSMPAPAPHQ